MVAEIPKLLKKSLVTTRESSRMKEKHYGAYPTQMTDEYLK